MTVAGKSGEMFKKKGNESWVLRDSESVRPRRQTWRSQLAVNDERLVSEKLQSHRSLEIRVSSHSRYSRSQKRYTSS